MEVLSMTIRQNERYSKIQIYTYYYRSTLLNPL